MKSLRLALTLALLAAAAVLGALDPGSSAAGTTPPRAELTQSACVHALNPSNRAISVLTVMRPLTGTKKLELRFDLIERTATAPAPAVVSAGDLGVWITPTDPTLGQLPGDVWRLDKTVLDLDAPASYQFRVDFRWIGAHDRVLGTTSRFGRTCHQRELRPDLLVESITVSPIAGHPEEDLYSAIIADQGLTGAGPFEVLFAPGDSSSPATRIVQFLGAGQSRELSFTGPACSAADPPTVTVDATAQVDDYNRANNEMAAVCPATTTPSTAAAAGSSSSAVAGTSSASSGAGATTRRR